MTSVVLFLIVWVDPKEWWFAGMSKNKRYLESSVSRKALKNVPPLKKTHQEIVISFPGTGSNICLCHDERMAKCHMCPKRKSIPTKAGLSLGSKDH